MNQLKAFGYLFGLSILFLLLGHVIASHSGVYVAVVLVVFMNINALVYGDKLALSMYSPKKVEADEHPDVFKKITALSEKAGITVPSLYIMESDAVNGLSIGSNPSKSALILTKGLVEKMGAAELDAVIAYLIAQIQTRETFLGTVTASVSHSVLSIFNLESWKKVFGIKTNEQPSDENPFGVGGTMAAPLASLFTKIAISKVRIINLDAEAINLCGNSSALAKALELIESEKQHHAFPLADLHPSSAILFISNPIKNTRLNHYFGIFPDIEDRISNFKIEKEMTA